MRGGWGGRCWGFGDVTGVGLWGGIFKGEVQIVDEETDIHVRHGDFKFVAELFLYGGEVGAIRDPGGDGGFLRGGEGHGGRVNVKIGTAKFKRRTLGFAEIPLTLPL